MILTLGEIQVDLSGLLEGSVENNEELHQELFSMPEIHQQPYRQATIL